MRFQEKVNCLHKHIICKMKNYYQQTMNKIFCFSDVMMLSIVAYAVRILIIIAIIAVVFILVFRLTRKK